jgi:hypothetical protein
VWPLAAFVCAFCVRCCAVGAAVSWDDTFFCAKMVVYVFAALR